MKAPAVPLVHCHAETAAHQELAAAVIRQALTDLRDPRASVRGSATVFLAGNDAMRWWCEVAGLEPDEVVGRAYPIVYGSDYASHVDYEPVMDSSAARTFTDANGRYLLCGIPADSPAVIGVAFNGVAKYATAAPGQTDGVDIVFP
jgi:hypothetical protein